MYIDDCDTYFALLRYKNSIASKDRISRELLTSKQSGINIFIKILKQEENYGVLCRYCFCLNLFI